VIEYPCSVGGVGLEEGLSYFVTQTFGPEDRTAVFELAQLGPSYPAKDGIRLALRSEERPAEPTREYSKRSHFAGYGDARLSSRRRKLTERSQSRQARDPSLMIDGNLWRPGTSGGANERLKSKPRPSRRCAERSHFGKSDSAPAEAYQRMVGGYVGSVDAAQVTKTSGGIPAAKPMHDRS
jgi:hypothetical protein